MMGLNRLAPLEQLCLLFADPFALAPVHDAHIRVVRIHPPIAQIDERRCGLGVRVLHQDRGQLKLLKLLGQGVPVVRIAVERPRAHDQVVL
jgi:hypothetical protein